ncbi:MAG: fluoride efflux transporter CrcB [Alphaproteobacteria bacterium]|nr:fluoride efflux transporter CrcB [Alphaproteobacteria bacterium]
MNMILAIALGGGLGSVTRHYAIAGTNSLLGGGFPYGTLLVNVLGSFIIGALMEAMALKWQVSLETRAFLVTGFLGGFTTFSAFSFDVLKLVDTDQYLPAFFYVFASVALSLAVIFLAVHLIRGVLS